MAKGYCKKRKKKNHKVSTVWLSVSRSLVCGAIRDGRLEMKVVLSNAGDFSSSS